MTTAQNISTFNQMPREKVNTPVKLKKYTKYPDTGRVVVKVTDLFGKITKFVVNILQIPLMALGIGSPGSQSLLLAFNIGKQITKGTDTALLVDKCKKRIDAFKSTENQNRSLQNNLSDLKLILAIVSKIGVMPTELCPIFSLIKDSINLCSDTVNLAEESKLLIECKQIITSCDQKISKWNEKVKDVQCIKNGDVENLELLIAKYRSKIEFFLNHKVVPETGATEQKLYKYIQILDGLEGIRLKESSIDLKEVTQNLNHMYSNKLKAWTLKKETTVTINQKSIFEVVTNVIKIAATVISVISIIFLMVGFGTSFAIPLLCGSLIVTATGIAKFIFDEITNRKLRKLATA